jgi:hypothetical protein
MGPDKEYSETSLRFSDTHTANSVTDCPYKSDPLQENTESDARHGKLREHHHNMQSLGHLVPATKKLGFTEFST